MDRQEITLGTLSRNQLDSLQRFADEARQADLMDLLRETHEHLDAARQAHKSDPLVNLALATGNDHRHEPGRATVSDYAGAATGFQRTYVKP